MPKFIEIPFTKDKVLERIEWHGDTLIYFYEKNGDDQQYTMIHDTMGAYYQTGQHLKEIKPEDMLGWDDILMLYGNKSE